MKAPVVSNIRIYPIKALDPVELSEAEIGIHSLAYDRAFALQGTDGRYINGKKTGRVNQLEAKYDLSRKEVQLRDRGSADWKSFELNEKNPELLDYLRAFFDADLSLVQSSKGALMDMPEKGSLTVLSEASLLFLQKTFPDLSLDNLRLRFRANIELSGVDAFWEEKLFGSPGTGKRFSIGEVEMIGISPRIRCSVPPRDPHTGESDRSFMKTMMQSRANNLPEGSTLLEHGNTYFLAVNTYLPLSEKGKKIRLGDPVQILESVSV